MSSLNSAILNVLALLLFSGARLTSIAASHDQWEPEIRAFEAADKTNPPPRGGIVFVGSSSIRLWKSLAGDFRGRLVINRGFGGSTLDDAVYFSDRIVLPYRPKQVVVYAGDNDLAGGRSPEQISSDFRAFVQKVHATLPEARIAYISIKPSPSRWKLAEQMRQANQLIATFTRENQRLAYIDVFTPMLDANSQPREELFIEDKLHMNRKGYDLWTRLVRPYLVTTE